jgi:hypothetical protein
VRIAVVDLKGKAVFFSHPYVLTETAPLQFVQGLLGAKEIKTCFPNRNDPWLACKSPDFLESFLKLTLQVELGCFIGVQGHCSEHSGLAGRECHRPGGRLNIGAHLNNTCDPDSLGPV